MELNLGPESGFSHLRRHSSRQPSTLELSLEKTSGFANTVTFSSNTLRLKSICRKWLTVLADVMFPNVTEIVKPSPHDRWQVTFHTEKGASWVMWHSRSAPVIELCLQHWFFLTVLIIILILNSPFLKERGVPPFRSSFVNLFPGNLKGFFLSNSGRILIDFWNCWT